MTGSPEGEAAGVLSLQSVVKVFSTGGREVRPVDGVSFNLQPARTIALTGRSGSGKSTLLNLLGLLDVPTAGRVMLAGRDAAQLSDAERTRYRGRHLGFVFQDALVDPNRTALQNVELGLRLAGVRRAGRQEQAVQTLVEVGLGERIGAIARNLSGGERQRVALARALAHHPSVLLCDEPTGNLDEANTEVVFQLLLAAAAKGRCVVLVTHENDLAARCDEQLVLSGGRLVPPAGHR